MRFLITGATGLLGHEITHELVSLNHEVYLIGRKRGHQNDGVYWIECDLSENWDIKKMPTEMDVVFHLAQSNHFREFPEQAMDVYKVNTASTMNLLDYAYRAGVKKFIYASSGGVYGSGPLPFNELDSPINLDTRNFYINSKRASESLVHCYSHLLDTSILRYFFIYGKRQSRSMLIPRLVDNIKNGQSISLNGLHGIKINPIHVSDAAKASIAAMNTEGSHTFNIAGSEILTLRDIAEVIGEKVNIEPKFSSNNIQANDLIADIHRMKKMLWSPVSSFSDGISELI